MLLFQSESAAAQYIERVAREIGIGPIGIAHGEKTQIIAARNAVYISFFKFIELSNVEIKHT